MGGGQWWIDGKSFWGKGDNWVQGCETCLQVCASVQAFLMLLYNSSVLPSPEISLPNGLAPVLDPRWRPLRGKEKELVKLGSEIDSQRSQILKGKVVEAADFGLDLGWGGAYFWARHM